MKKLTSMLKRNLVICLLLVLSLNFIFFVFYKKSIPSIVYVDSNKLFTEFKMTKELKIKGEKELQFKKHQLDSLQFLLKATVDNDRRSAILQQLINEKQIIEEFQLNYSQLNSEKIMERISIYTKDFAELNDYDLIIGSRGKDQLLYGKKDKDVTVLLLQYLNEKYEGFQ